MSKKTFRITFLVDGFTLKKVNEFYSHFHPLHSNIDFRGLKNWARIEALRIFCPKKKYALMDCHYYHPYKNPNLYGQVSCGMNSFEREMRYAGFQIHYTDNEYLTKAMPNMGLMEDALLFASYKKMDVIVLLTTQGQYSPLPERLNSMGIPTLLLGWNFSYPKDGYFVHWQTDSLLKEKSSYYIAMENVTDNITVSSQSPFLIKKKNVLVA